jgi:hypothetical protein
MIMRATVERSSPQPDDPWGRPGPPVYAVIEEDVPCRAWSKSRRELRNDGKQVAVEDLRAIFPGTSDVAEEDRLTIEDRRGTVVFGGPVAVETVVQRGLYAPTGHLELMLTRHTAALAPEVT